MEYAHAAASLRTLFEEQNDSLRRRSALRAFWKPGVVTVDETVELQEDDAATINEEAAHILKSLKMLLLLSNFSMAAAP